MFQCEETGEARGGTVRIQEDLRITELTGREPRRESASCLNAWPHEHLVSG
ncbi:MAG: hypothetical protein OXN97_15385 [Bryobacterales bacterium]|nr:hypothetical protein [Bryobacterales bacterium]